MFAIDFTKPYLYKDVVYFHQGNLSTNNTLRCTLNTGGSNDLTGCNIICTFKLQNSTEISGAGRIIDPLNAIVDLVFPSNALAVGLNKLEILVNRSDGSVAQSPSITYDIWQGLTTGNGVEVETNYPILIELINSTNEASNKANLALDKVNSMKVELEEVIDFSYRAANNADIAASNANYKIDEVDEKIGDVNRALAAGTVDLELKEARKDASGVVHDTVKQRLDSDLIVGDKSLKDFVIDMNGMKEYQDIEYETDKGYKVCQNTQNGVVKDLKIYGKSLVNICDNDFVKTNSGIYYHTINKSMFPFGEDVTIKVFKENDSSLQYLKWAFYGVDNEGVARVIKGYTTDFSQTTLNIKDTYPSYRLYLQSHDGNNYVDFDRTKVKACIVRGREEITTYFEGITSIGNDNKIEVSSIKWSGNLFDENQLKPYIKSENETECTIDFLTIWDRKVKLADLPFKENTSYKFICTQKCSDGVTKPRFYFHYTDGTEDNVTIANIDWATVTAISRPNKTLEYISATYGNSGGTWTIKKNSICLYEDMSKSEHEPFEQDKKTILFKDADNTWKPVIELNEWDTLDTTVSKLIIGTEKVSFSTNSNWRDNQSPSTTHKTYWRKYEGYKLSNVICDKLPVCNYAEFNKKCIFVINNEYLYFTIPISECSDISKLGEWFVANPMNILIPTPIKKEYEINPIYPESYENETIMSFGSGAIAPHASWKITSSLPNFVKELSNQIKQLQEQVYKTNVANFAVALNTLDTKLRLDRLEAPQQ